MAIVIKVVSFANGNECPIAGMYMRAFDFEYKQGLGIGTFTHDIARAMRFRDINGARDFWRRQSERYPLRRDGQPNCPFMSSNVEFEHTGEQWH